MGIDKNSKMPLHYQIFLDLKSKIKDGVYKVDEKLLSERELQEVYNVSRMTVRTAVQELEKEGLVKKLRGIGTIICEEQHEFNLQKLTSFSHDSSLYGEEASSILRSFALVEATKKIATELNIEEGQLVYYIERARLRGNVIIGLHKAYINPVKRLTLVKEEFSATTSLYNVLQQKGIPLLTAEETMEATIATEEIAKALQVKKNQPVFYKERITFTENKEPIEYVEIFYRADAYKYKVTLDLNQ